MNDNQYPRGKLNEEDEGQTPIGITVKDSTVILKFLKPMAWVGLDKKSALKFAEMITKHANSIQVM